MNVRVGKKSREKGVLKGKNMILKGGPKFSFQGLTPDMVTPDMVADLVVRQFIQTGHIKPMP
jgi:hypothetical protein